MFRINSHPDIHPESVHASTRESGANEGSGSTKTAPVSVASPETAGFSTTPRTGQPTGMASTFVSPDRPARVSLPGDSTAYYVKGSSKAGVPQALYTRDPQTGVLKQTSKQAVSDGGGWKAVDGLKGGLNYSPEARAARLQDAQHQYDLAVQRLGRAQSGLHETEQEYEAAQNLVYQAKGRVVTTKDNIRVVSERINFWQTERIKARNDLAGAQSQLTSITDSENASAARLVHAQSQLINASRSLNVAERRLRDANNTMQTVQRQLAVSRQALMSHETALTTAADQLTSSQNALRTATADVSEASEALRNAQSP
ncbi:hypothetical protein [Dyella monticola]|nr:hypothetical protein [Dyella monticola]